MIADMTRVSPRVRLTIMNYLDAPDFEGVNKRHGRRQNSCFAYTDGVIQDSKAINSEYLSSHPEFYDGVAGPTTGCVIIVIYPALSGGTCG